MNIVWKNQTRLWFLIPVIIILLILCYFPLKRSIAALGYPYQLDYAEGFLAVESDMISRGESMYPSIEEYPYLVGNYPPVYPLLSVPFFLIFGPSLFWGRLICFVSVAGIAFLSGWIVYHKTKMIIPAFLAPLLFLNTYALHEWIAYSRVDLPAIFFSVAGIAVLSSGTNKKHRYAALALFLLSVYTKQIQIFAPASACLYLIVRNRKQGLMFTAQFIGLTLGIFLFLTLITGGRYFHHTVTYNANKYDFWQLRRWVEHIFRFYFMYLATALIIFASYIIMNMKTRTAEKKFRPELFSIYALAGIVSVPAIGKIGAASNYLLEFHISLGIAFTIIFIRVFNRVFESKRKKGLIALLIVSVLLLTVHGSMIWKKRAMIFSRPDPGKSARLKGDEMLRIVKDYPEPVLCEEPVFPLLAGKKVVFQPFIMSELSKENKWDQSDFIRDLENKKFTLIQTGQDMYAEGHSWQYTKEMRNAVRENYFPLLRNRSVFRKFMESPVGGIPYYIYVPKERKDAGKNTE